MLNVDSCTTLVCLHTADHQSSTQSNKNMKSKQTSKQTKHTHGHTKSHINDIQVPELSFCLNIQQDKLRSNFQCILLKKWPLDIQCLILAGRLWRSPWRRGAFRLAPGKDDKSSYKKILNHHIMITMSMMAMLMMITSWKQLCDYEVSFCGEKL